MYGDKKKLKMVSDPVVEKYVRKIKKSVIKINNSYKIFR